MGALEDHNVELIEAFWADLFRRDFDAVGAWFTPDGNYRDVPAPEIDELRQEGE